jgi:tripartite-type tricarboxylate transporter receptor subunit TctC
MKLSRVLSIALVLGATTAGLAQDYPARPIRLVVPFGAGGGTDNLARIIEPHLSKALGQSLVIENKPGAGSIIGADLVAKAEPNGYTLLMVDSSFSANPGLYKSLPYDTARDLAPVSLLATAPVILVAHASVKAATIREFVALARSRPGALNYASGGNGSSTHLGGELLKLVAGIDVVHIPYKGTGPAMNDLIGGHVDAMFSGISSALPHIEAGRLRAFAVTGDERSSAVPDVPTFREAGLAGVTASTYWGVLAPAVTPQPIIDRLATAFADAMRDPDIVARIAPLGYVPIGGGPADFAQNLRSEIEKWDAVIKRANIRVD